MNRSLVDMTARELARNFIASSRIASSREFDGRLVHGFLWIDTTGAVAIGTFSTSHVT
jgi:acyl dehydratase